MKVRRKEMEGKNRGGKPQVDARCLSATARISFSPFTASRARLRCDLPSCTSTRSGTWMWMTAEACLRVQMLMMRSSLLYELSQLLLQGAQSSSPPPLLPPPTHTFSSSNKPQARGWGINSRGGGERKPKSFGNLRQQTKNLDALFVSFCLHFFLIPLVVNRKCPLDPRKGGILQLTEHCMRPSVLERLDETGLAG